jgi:DNA-binding beta-propeller fold protein YncE
MFLPVPQLEIQKISEWSVIRIFVKVHNVFFVWNTGPKGVAVDGEGKIYVVDNKASSVCVFQKNGRLVGRFGSRGCTEDHLAGPHFIAINSFGHSVVSDFHNHAVKVRVRLNASLP